MDSYTGSIAGKFRADQGKSRYRGTNAGVTITEPAEKEKYTVAQEEKMADTIYMNRELSWLKFNERVLEEAENPENPLCERLTFASIYQSNLDEFYMVRVGSLVDQMLLAKDIRENKTNMTPKEQLDAILARTKKLNRKRDVVYEEIMESLEEYGVHMLNFHKIEKEDRNYLERYFEAEVAPVISPSIVGKRQPFPFLRNKEIYAVVVLETKKGKEKLGIIPCSSAGIQRLIPVPGKTGTYMLSEELILHFVSKIFKGYHIKAKSLLRITRNADIDADALYDEDLDYREFMVELIKARKKLAPIRLELSREMDGDVVETLCEYLEVDKNFVFRGDIPLDLSFVFQIQDGLRKRTELFYEKRIPQKSPMFNSHEPILDQIAKKDRFLSYPYESIKPFLTMLHEAANDDDVVSIKMTLYRVAKQSKVVEALIEAAENGKEVLVLVELKARFDEENNIGWSRLLEDAGCRVIYGLDGYKVHSKLCLITKKTDEQIEYYTQIGTGNYNEKTSRLYTDLSLMTYNVDIGLEGANVFEALAMGDRILIMKNGKIEQVGTPEEIYLHPQTEFAASFVSKCNFVRGQWNDPYFKVMDQSLEYAGPEVAQAFKKHGLFPVRPEQFCIVKEGNGIPATVTNRQYSGREIHYSLKCGEDTFTVYAGSREQYEPGEQVKLIYQAS